MSIKTASNLKNAFYTDALTVFYCSSLLYYVVQHSLHLKFGHEDSLYLVLFLAAAELLKAAFLQIYSKTLRTTATNILRAATLLSCVFFAVYLIAVLLGAAFSHVQLTSVLALLVTTLGALPACLNLGVDAAAALIINVISYECEGAQYMFLVKLRSVLFGSWLGAIVIPLDWNRPWQEWPIPCCMGAVLGYIAGCLLCCGFYLKGVKSAERKTGKYAL